MATDTFAMGISEPVSTSAGGALPEAGALGRPLPFDTWAVPYPPRPTLRPLPEFAETRDSAHPLLQSRLEASIVGQYAEGRSLREIAELVERSQTAVRRALDKHQVPRRPAGAGPLADQ